MNASPDAKLHLDHWRIIRTRIGLAFLIFLLALGVAAAITYFTPTENLASVTIEVVPSLANANSEPGNQSKVAPPEIQSVLSRRLLASVVEHSDLQKKWAVKGAELQLETACDKLLGMTEQQEEPPNHSRINVRSFDQKEAEVLANAIAQEYVDERASDQQNIFEKTRNELQDAIQKREKSVSTAFARASRLRTEAGYVDPDPDSNDVSKRIEEPSEASQAKIIETQTIIANLKNRVDALDRLKSGDLAHATELLNLNDPILEQKLPLYQNAIAERTRLLSSGLGHNHPDVRAVQRQIDAIQGQLGQEIANIREGLAAQLTAAEGSLKTLKTSSGTSQIEQKRKDTDDQFLAAKQEYDLQRQALENAKTQLDAKTTEQSKAPKPATISESAKTASSSNHPEGRLNLLWGAVVGLTLGAGFALLLEKSGTSIKKLEEVEQRLRLPLLAAIPKNSDHPLQGKPKKWSTQPYQILKTHVDSARQRAAASILTVVSAGPAEGKSTTVANLATLYAADEQQTLIVDAAQHRPTQHQLLRLDNRVGLSDYLRGEKGFDEVIQNCGVPNLFAITSGPASDSTPLSAEKLGELVTTAKDWFDVVIFDCPRVLGVSEASVICALAEGTIVVAQHRRFPRSMIIKAKDFLQKLDTKMLGVVLTNAYVKFEPKRPLPGVAAPKRSNDELVISEFEAATNRAPGDDAF